MKVNTASQGVKCDLCGKLYPSSVIRDHRLVCAAMVATPRGGAHSFCRGPPLPSLGTSLVTGYEDICSGLSTVSGRSDHHHHVSSPPRENGGRSSSAGSKTTTMLRVDVLSAARASSVILLLLHFLMFR